MQMNRYQTPADLRTRPGGFDALGVAIDGHSNYLHQGDIGHRLFNGAHGYDSGDILRYWTDAAGEIQAFALVYPHWSGFDLQAAPQVKKSALHGDILAFCERETLRLADKYDKTIDALGTEADDSDADFVAFLQGHGYEHSKHAVTLTRHDLERLPEAALPAGFRFPRSDAGRCRAAGGCAQSQLHFQVETRTAMGRCFARRTWSWNWWWSRLTGASPPSSICGMTR